ncbi:unnamed protein product, partial [Mesorhabditis spiculigera]
MSAAVARRTGSMTLMACSPAKVYDNPKSKIVCGDNCQQGDRCPYHTLQRFLAKGFRAELIKRRKLPQ